MKSVPRGAWLTFALALVIALGWASIEVSLRLGQVPETKASDAVCRRTPFAVTTLPGSQLLSLQGRELRAYDKVRESLVVYELSSTAGPQALRLAATIPLRCQTPGYGCFPPFSAGGPETFEVLMADDSHGLIRASEGATKVDFPFEWGARGFHLGTPLRLCGSALSWERRHLAWTSSSLIAVDHESRRIGTFRVTEFKGSLWREVPREPDQVWGFDEKFALKESSCSTESPQTRLNLGTFNGLLWLLKDDAAGSDFTLYNMDSGLQPVEADELRGPWRRAHTLSPTALLLEGTGNRDWLHASWDERGPRLDPLPASAFSTPPLSSFRAGPEASVLQWSSERWLAPPHLALVSKTGERPLGDGRTVFRAAPPSDWGLATLDSRNFVWAFQAGDDIEMHKVECARGLTGPSK